MAISKLPLEEFGFTLYKREYRDALCLRYGWSLSHLTSTCTCSQSFSADHAITRNLGGYRDLTASLLSEV